MNEQFLSAAEVASAVGNSYRTIENWAARGKIERSNGKYGLISALKFRISLLEKEIENNAPSGDLNELKLQKLAAEVKKENAIAGLKQLELETAEGKLVEAEEVAIAWSNLVINARAKFLSLPAKLALELAGEKDPEAVQEKLQLVIDEALMELGESNTDN